MGENKNIPNNDKQYVFDAVIGKSEAANLPEGYDTWRKEIITLVEQAKYKAALSVNSELLALYWKIGTDIIRKQKELGWGTGVIALLSKDLTDRFPEDRGYSERNLRNMKRFAEAYPHFPFLQVPLAEIDGDEIWQVSLAKLKEEGKDFVQVPLAQITWYHHISLFPKVKDIARRAFYIMATAQEGWSRDVMLMQIDHGYIEAKGNSINNFTATLPPIQSDLARYTCVTNSPRNRATLRLMLGSPKSSGRMSFIGIQRNSATSSCASSAPSSILHRNMASTVWTLKPEKG